MIELTEQQMQAVATGGNTPPVVVDPTTKPPYVLLRQDVYELLRKDEDYDDTPWTDEEMELLAWEAGKQAGWENMDEYDHYPEKPAEARLGQNIGVGQEKVSGHFLMRPNKGI